ncbi:hypothetical protein pqer_cds_959 [Pandoravirus quercus]|uniref:Uncharacterized protein n=1 Tax=Pandoravirus quercus TaxID=2107709 RepID=A0A2U7UAB2_9VIRU|nr:hypothetical protein pqer_cds_959 [Pandoravirus quercus]AVK75381.1 hypothetical protein pqer_cds_959 [Pandoravirus quercus]
MDRLVIFFNAAQETAPLPPSGRYVLPEDAVAASAVVFVDGRDGPAPVPFSVEGGASLAQVTVVKDGANFAGDLISLDPHSVTLATGRGVTQTVEAYESVSVQQRDRPVVAVASGASLLGDGARVAFMREGLSWRPSYLIYLGDGPRYGDRDVVGDDNNVASGNTNIRQIVGVADIANRRDETVTADDVWLAAARVPLPPPQVPPPRPRAVAMMASQDASEEAPRMLMASRAAAPSAYSPEVYGGNADQDATKNDDDDKDTNYHVGPLALDRGASLTLPLFVAGAPTEQAEVRFGTLPTGPSAPGDRATPVVRGYRFVAQGPMPAGRATVFDPDMRFAGIADVSSAVPGEPVDLVLGPSTDINVDAWVQVTTTYEPLASVYNDIGDGPAESIRSDDTWYNNDVNDTGPDGSATRDRTRPVVARIVDRVAIRGTVHNGADRPVLLVLAYRPVFGGVVCASEPPYDRMTRGVIEWQAVVPPGSTDLEIDLDVDRGQRLLPGPSP